MRCRICGDRLTRFTSLTGLRQTCDECAAVLHRITEVHGDHHKQALPVAGQSLRVAAHRATVEAGGKLFE